MSYEVPFMDIDIEKYGNCKCKVCKKRKKKEETKKRRLVNVD